MDYRRPAIGVLSLALGVAGCDQDAGHGHDHDHDHGHAHDHDHDHGVEHEEGAEAGAEADDHGKANVLGKQEHAGFSVQATLYGQVKPGEEAAADVEVSGAALEAVRLWIGEESGRGATKSKGEPKKDGGYHFHIEVPATIPEGAKLWVELDTGKEDMPVVSFEIDAALAGE